MSDKTTWKIGKINSEIPVPETRPYRRVSYPFAKMAVGENVLILGLNENAVRSAAAKWKSRHRGWNYSVRVTDKGIRVWRTA